MNHADDANSNKQELHVGSNPHAKGWYVLLCKAKQDHVAEENLMRQGFTCYRPEVIDTTNGKPVKKSLFPGYIFVFLSRNQDWSPIRSTKGIQRFVQFGVEPKSVSATIIDEIKKRLSGFALSQTTSCSREHYSVWLEEIFKEADSLTRTCLLIKLMQKTM